MKFRLTFKTPDVLDQVLSKYMDTPNEHFPCSHEDFDGNCDRCNEVEEECLTNIDTIQKAAEKFIRYGECITIEFDSEMGTATIIPVK